MSRRSGMLSHHRCVKIAIVEKRFLTRMTAEADRLWRGRANGGRKKRILTRMTDLALCVLPVGLAWGFSEDIPR